MPEGNSRQFEHDGDCRHCLGGGGPERCHKLCQLPLPEAEAVAYQIVIEAAQRGDLRTVVLAGRRVPSVISFNGARHSIQIVGCDGMLVANLPVRGDATTIVAAARELAEVAPKLGLGEER